MKTNDYFGRLNSYLNNIEATDSDGKPLDIEGAMNAAIKVIIDQSEKGRKVILVGNGGSASIANHITVDLWKNGGIRAVSFSESSLLTCMGNDYGYPHVFEKPIEMFADKGDVLIAISSSGMSENILRAVDAGCKIDCDIITMSGFKPDNKLRLKGSLNFYVPSDSYGFVEIAHLVLCHYIADTIVQRKKENG